MTIVEAEFNYMDSLDPDVAGKLTVSNLPGGCTDVDLNILGRTLESFMSDKLGSTVELVAISDIGYGFVTVTP